MIIPFYPNILIAPCLKESGGLALPDEMKEQPGEGIVVEVYEGCKIKKGDKLLFNKYKPTRISESGQILYLVNDEDVLAKII